MATVGPRAREIPLSEYPTGDGKPMAETPVHRRIMTALIDVLETRYVDAPMVYVSGNMLMYYVRNDKRRHLSPDVFLVKGIRKEVRRDAYFTWIEGKGPDVVFEISSSSTRKEDTDKKYRLYQDILHVSEYILFDPYEDYLKPSLQGFRLRNGLYVPIELVAGRLGSEVLGLPMGREGEMLRLYDPASGDRLLTAQEQRDAAEAALRQAEAARLAAEEERDQLRRELAELRKRVNRKT
jgi:Uma2 family endonuclease